MITQRQSDKIFKLAYDLSTAAVELERADYPQMDEKSRKYTNAELKLQDYLLRLRLGQED